MSSGTIWSQTSDATGANPLGLRGFGDNQPGMVGHCPQIAFERLHTPIRQRTTTPHEPRSKFPKLVRG